MKIGDFMKIKRIIEIHKEQEENFLGLTLLSKEEHEEYKNNISVIKFLVATVARVNSDARM